MKTTSPTKQFRSLTLDNIGSAGVLFAAVLIVASGAFSAFTGSTLPAMQLAQQTGNRTVVAASHVSPASQRVLATPTTVRPMMVAANR